MVKYMINPNLERGSRNASSGILAHDSIYSSYGKMCADHKLIGPLAADSQIQHTRFNATQALG